MRVTANGIDVNYTLEGPDGAPVVTFSHSLAADLTMWDPQAAAFQSRYRVLRYDTRGHGGTDAPNEAYTFDQLADDARALLEALGIERTHFVGLSMGGMIGQTLALRHPGVVNGLVLCDTSSAMPPDAPAMWGERIAAAREGGMAALADGTLERWFTPKFLADHPDVIAPVRAQILATPVDGFSGCGNAIMHLNLTDQLPAITAPTLVMVGEEDPGTPVAVHEVIRDQIPGAKLVVLPSAMHLSNIEQAEKFNGALGEFLDGL
jgi:3-oxoadipate enol-lactonase